MSDLIFPVLQGLGYTKHKIPTWGTRTQRSVSGRELAIRDYSNPIWNFKLTFEFLRDRAVGEWAGGWTSEVRKLMDFFLLMNGANDTFLFDDPDDNNTIQEVMPLIECETAKFQLTRRLYANGFPEAIIAPNVITEIAIDGIPTLDYTVDVHTGIVTLDPAPDPGVVVTATYSYYFRCRFMTDSADFDKWSYKRWELPELKLKSVLL